MKFETKIFSVKSDTKREAEKFLTLHKLFHAHTYIQSKTNYMKNLCNIAHR